MVIKTTQFVSESFNFILKSRKIQFVLMFFFFLLFGNSIQAQCTTGCTVSNPPSGNYTFLANNTICFTANTTLGDVTFQNNVKVCVAPGVTVIVNNNIGSTSWHSLTLDVYGTLQFNNAPQFQSNLTINVYSGGTLKSGSTGGNNFAFNGTTNTVTNNGTIQVAVLDFKMMTNFSPDVVSGTQGQRVIFNNSSQKYVNASYMVTTQVACAVANGCFQII